MPPKSPGRPRSKRAQTAILGSAYALLEERGLAGVTIEAVAERAGVGKPTIYRYWANARELAMAAFMDQTELSVEAAEHEATITSLKNQLQRVVGRFATTAGRQSAVLMASADADSELSKAFRNQIILKSREEGRNILQRGMAKGEIRTDIPIETLLDMIYGPIFYRLLAGHAPLHDTFAEEIINLTLSSIVSCE